MPLEIPETVAVHLAANRIREQDGDTHGVQNFLRGLGAHSEQAKALGLQALGVYQMSEDVDVPQGSEPTVQAAVEVDGREMNIVLKSDRLPITTFDELVDFYDIDTEVWQPQSQLFNFWGSKQNPNFQVKANFKKNDYKDSLAEDRAAFREWASGLTRVSWDSEKDRVYPAPTEEVMIELVLSDLHVEKHSLDGEGLDGYLSLVSFGAAHLLSESAAVYGAVEEIHIVLLGDTFNSDNLKGTTTKGTPQENVSGYRETFSRTRETIAGLVEYAVRYAPMVVLHVIPGNHDRERSYYLADSLWAYFKEHPGVTVEVPDTSRQYIRWGNSLIGLAHGDDVKPMDLVMSMFREQSTDGVVYPVWHLGHYHTRREDEVHGVLLRYFRTARGSGEWEEPKGYGHNKKDMVAIVHHKDIGDIAEFRMPMGE